MTTMDEKIAALEQRLQQMKTHQQRIEARKRTLASRRARKDNTRRKILIGAIVQAKIAQGEFAESTLRHWLDKALVRSDDRELFELPPMLNRSE